MALPIVSSSSIFFRTMYGSIDDLEGATRKDAAAGGSTRRFTVLAAVGVVGLMGFAALSAPSSRSGAMTSLYGNLVESGMDMGQHIAEHAIDGTEVYMNHYSEGYNDGRNGNAGHVSKTASEAQKRGYTRDHKDGSKDRKHNKEHTKEHTKNDNNLGRPQGLGPREPRAGRGPGRPPRAKQTPTSSLKMAKSTARRLQGGTMAGWISPKRTAS